MQLEEKLRILTESAKYDASCASSGSRRKGVAGSIGSTSNAGCCHSFSADGRCVSLLKVLFTNYCINDCKYCTCRSSNDIERAAFTPRELADLCMNFYLRNYIDGLFLSSGVIKNPDYTAEQLIATLKILREEYRFNGYIHVKAIPGASAWLIYRLGLLADRMSANIELPSEDSLKLLAPQKSREKVLAPMAQIRDGIIVQRNDIKLYKNAPQFVPAGQSTQMIVGATGETDFHILRLSEALYKKFALKRVYYSAYIPVGNHVALPKSKPPLLREHRLYQADWLLRFYGFKAEEILDEKHSSLDDNLDPKCNWAMNHLELFPVEVNSAPREMLLRVPGIGVRSTNRILRARRSCALGFDELKRLGVVIKRARYFITCNGKHMIPGCNEQAIYQALICAPQMSEQMSLFDPAVGLLGNSEEMQKCLTGEL
ncbi:MAG: putative DNA modification/repair radical SAM protein [Clostridia bacterium]|nr:putative DNA modification/repair radical SAM protein [Clostridia bacterium]